MTQPSVPFADEIILYRTHKDYLTNNRLFAGGQSYFLKDLRHAQVAPTPILVPLLIVRCVALLISVVYLVDIIGLVSTLEEPESVYVRLALVIVTGLFAVGAAWFVTGFSIRVTLHDGRRIRVMHANDRHGLQGVANDMNVLFTDFEQQRQQK